MSEQKDKNENNDKHYENCVQIVSTLTMTSS